MRDQHEKIELLRALGASEIMEPGCEHQLIAAALGVSKSTWSGFSKQNDFLTLPLKHQARLGEIYGFDHTWPEWLEGGFEEFRIRYLEHHGLGDDPKARAIVEKIKARGAVEIGNISAESENGGAEARVSDIEGDSVKIGDISSISRRTGR